jgi:predicted nucleic acid-binding Zn ribbon protein
MHTGWWILKGVYYFLLIILSFVLPNTFYTGYANAARIGSVMFLILQMFVIIDFTYRWNGSWVARAEDQERDGKAMGAKKWYCFILTACGFLIFGSIVGWGLMYKFLAGADSCSVERFIISFTLILCVGFTILSVSGIAEFGALLPSAALMFYCTYLIFTGLKSNPNTTCNLYSLGTTTSATSDPLQIAVGLGFAAISITYSCYSLASDTKVLFGGGGSAPAAAAPDKVTYDDEEPKKPEEKPITPASKDAEVDGEEPEEVLNDPQTRKTNFLFHFILLLASMYFGMLLTDWASNLYDNSNKISNLGTANMWANVGAAWLISLMYMWTLLAPKACPGRDFS